MFHVELAPLGGILGPLKSDLGVFWAKIPLYPYNVKFSNSIFSKSANLPILSFWILNVLIIIGQFQKRSTVKHFFSRSPCSCHMWIKWWKNQPSSTSASTCAQTLHYVYSRFWPILAPMWVGFSELTFFPLSTSTWNFQGSISNASGIFEPKTTASSHL